MTLNSSLEDHVPSLLRRNLFTHSITKTFIYLVHRVHTTASISNSYFNQYINFKTELTSCSQL